MGYIQHAMETGIPGERDKDFTTVGKPKVTVIVTIVKVVYIRLHLMITLRLGKL